MDKLPFWGTSSVGSFRKSNFCVPFRHWGNAQLMLFFYLLSMYTGKFDQIFRGILMGRCDYDYSGVQMSVYT